MLNKKNYAFTIWGIKEGFTQNILCSDLVEEVTAFQNDSVRQLCNGASSLFFSIEKTKNFSMVTIFNSKTMDHIKRPAYIAITLFTKTGNQFNGGVIKTLTNLMQYYVLKQGTSMENNFTENMFAEQMLDLHVSINYNLFFSKNTEKLGYKLYNAETEIEPIFNMPTIEGYKRVFFFKEGVFKPNEQKTGYENLKNYECVKDFKKSYQISLLNYSFNKYKIEVNGETINPLTDGYKSKVPVFENDQVSITLIKTRNKKQINFYSSDITKDLDELFYVPKIEKEYFILAKRFKPILIGIAVLIFLIIGVFIFLYLKGNKPKQEKKLSEKKSISIDETKKTVPSKKENSNDTIKKPATSISETKDIKKENKEKTKTTAKQPAASNKNNKECEECEAELKRLENEKANCGDDANRDPCKKAQAAVKVKREECKKKCKK